jgi:penicillin-binding protein 1A
MTGGEMAAPIAGDFFKLALADKAAIPFRVPPGLTLIPIDRKTGMRSTAGGAGTILEAFKPGTGPPDTYSIIGQTDATGQPLTVTPEADRAVISGTGGHY